MPGATYGSGTYGSGTYGGTVAASLVSVTPNAIYTTAGPTLLTFNGQGTTWLSTPPSITISAGSLGAITATSNTTATATYTPPVTTQNVSITFTDVTDGSTVVLLSVIIVSTPPPQIAGRPPSVLVEVSFPTRPTDPPVWIDITGFVERLSITRGRQRELDRFQAGVLQMDLQNRDRRFDPTYVSSPYYGQVLPMKRVRVSATYNGAVIPLYSGYVESWGQHWRTWQDAVVTVTATDAMKPLNLAQLNITYPAQLSSDRINAVLDGIGWTIGGAAWVMGSARLGTDTILGPTGDRNLGIGLSMVQGSVLANISALSHMQDVTDTERGWLFVDRIGVVTFFPRDRAFQAAQLASTATFGEQEMPYVDLTFDYSDNQIWNDIRVTRQGGVQQTASDVASQQQYYLRTLSLTTLHNSDEDAQAVANMMVQKYPQPILEIIGMTLDGEANPSVIYPQMLNHELGDRITVRRRPAWGGMIEQVSLIQGINIDFDAAGGNWAVAWRLSAVDTATYWIMGDPTYGLLGTTTRLFT